MYIFIRYVVPYIIHTGMYIHIKCGAIAISLGILNMIYDPVWEII